MAVEGGGGEVDSVGSASVEINIDEEAFEASLARAEARLQEFVQKEWKVNLEAAFGENSSLIKSIKDAARVGDDESRRQSGSGSGGGDRRNATDIELNASDFAAKVRAELEGTPLRITLDQQFLRGQFESALGGISAPISPNIQQAPPGSPAGVPTGGTIPAGLSQAISGEGGQSVVRLYETLNEVRRTLGQGPLPAASGPAQALHSIVQGTGGGSRWRDIAQFPDATASEPSGGAIAGLIQQLRANNAMGANDSLINQLIADTQSAEAPFTSAMPHYSASSFGTPSQSSTVPPRIDPRQEPKYAGGEPAYSGQAASPIGSARDLQSEAMRRVATQAEQVMAQARYQAGLEEQAARPAPEMFSLSEITQAARMNPTLVRVPGQADNIRQYADRNQIEENAQYALGQIMQGLEARGRDPGMLGASPAYFTSAAAPIRYEAGQDPISHLMLMAAGGAYEHGGASMPLPHRVQGLFSGQTPGQAYRSAGRTKAQSFEAWMGAVGEWNDPGLPPGEERVATVDGEEIRWREGDLPPSVRDRAHAMGAGQVVGPRAGPRDVYEGPYIEMGGRGENFSPGRMLLPGANGGDVEVPASMIRAIESGAFTRMAARVRDDGSLDLESLWPLMLDMDEEGNLPIAKPGGRTTRNGVRYERVKQRQLLRAMFMGMGVDEEVVDQMLNGSVPETHAMEYGDNISRLGKSIDYGASTFTTRSRQGTSSEMGTPQEAGSSNRSLYRMGRDYSRSRLPRMAIMRRLQQAKLDLQALMDMPGAEFQGLSGQAAQEQIAYLTQLSQQLSIAENQLAQGQMPFTSEYDSTLNAESREAIEMGAYGGVQSDTKLRPVSVSERRRELQARLQAMPTEQELSLPISSLATDVSPHEQFRIMRMRAEREVLERELAHLDAPLTEGDREKVDRELAARAEHPEVADIEAQLLALRDVAGAGGLDVNGEPFFVPGIKQEGMGYYDRPGKYFTGLSQHEGLGKMMLDIVQDPELGIMDLAGNPRVNATDPFAVGDALERNPATAGIGRLIKGIISDNANVKRVARDRSEPTERARETRAMKTRMKSEAAPYRATQRIGDIDALLGERPGEGVPGKGLYLREDVLTRNIARAEKAERERVRALLYNQGDVRKQPTDDEIDQYMAEGETSADFRAAKSGIIRERGTVRGQITRYKKEQDRLREVEKLADQLLGKHQVTDTDEYGRERTRTEYDLPKPEEGKEGNFNDQRAMDTVLARGQNMANVDEGRDPQIVSMATEEALRQLRFRAPTAIGQNIVTNGPDLRTGDESRAVYQEQLGSELPTGEEFGNMQGPPGEGGGGAGQGAPMGPFRGLVNVWIKGPFPLAVRLSGSGDATSDTVAASSGQDATRAAAIVQQGAPQQQAVVGGAEIVAPPTSTGEDTAAMSRSTDIDLEAAQGRMLAGPDEGAWTSPLDRDDAMSDRDLKAAGLARQRRGPGGHFMSGIEPAGGPIQYLNAGEVGPLAEEVGPEGGLTMLGRSLSALEEKVSTQAELSGRAPDTTTVDRENRAANRGTREEMAKRAPSRNVIDTILRDLDVTETLAQPNELDMELTSLEGTYETQREARAIINKKRRQLPSRAPSTMMVQLTQGLFGGLDEPYEQIAEAEQALGMLGRIGGQRRKAQLNVDTAEKNIGTMTTARDFARELYEDTGNEKYLTEVERLTEGIAAEEVALEKATKQRDKYAEAEKEATKAVTDLAEGAVTGGNIMRNLLSGFAGGVAGGIVTQGISMGIQAITMSASALAPVIDKMTGRGMQAREDQRAMAELVKKGGGGRSAAVEGLLPLGVSAYDLEQMQPLIDQARVMAGNQNMLKITQQMESAYATQAGNAETGVGTEEYPWNLVRSESMLQMGQGTPQSGALRDFMTWVSGGNLGGGWIDIGENTMSTQKVMARRLELDQEQAEKRGETIGIGGIDLGPLGRILPDTARALTKMTPQLEQWNKNLEAAGLDFRFELGQMNEDVKDALTQAGAGDLEARMRNAVVKLTGTDDFTTDQINEILLAIEEGVETIDFATAFEEGMKKTSFSNQIWSIYQGRDINMRMNQQQAGLQSMANPIMPFGIGTFETGTDIEGQAGAIFARNAAAATSYEEAGLADLEQMLNESLDPANASTLMENIKTMREDLVQLNEAGADISKAQAWRNYAQQVKVAKWQVADLVALTGEGEGSVIGQMQRENMLLQRRSQLLGFERQQRQINFKVAVAGFNSVGLTGEERAMRLRIAQREAAIDQEQLDIGRTVGGNEFEIVQRQNDRALQQATFALRNLRQSFAEQQDMAKISQAIQVTTRALGENMKEVSILQSAEQQMLELEKQFTQDQANAAKDNLRAGNKAKEAAEMWDAGIANLATMVEEGVFKGVGNNEVNVEINVEGHAVDIDKLAAKVEKAIGDALGLLGGG